MKSTFAVATLFIGLCMLTPLIEGCTKTFDGKKKQRSPEEIESRLPYGNLQNPQIGAPDYDCPEGPPCMGQ